MAVFRLTFSCNGENYCIRGDPEGMTYKAVQDTLRKIGIVISKKGDTHRINYFFGLKDTAYYTQSLEEALHKGVEMAKPRR
jgi:hypothetical protein